MREAYWPEQDKHYLSSFKTCLTGFCGEAVEEVLVCFDFTPSKAMLYLSI